MRLDDTVTVECTDTDQKMDAQVVRMQGDRVDVMISGLILSLRRTKPGIYVGNRSGMEFVLKTK